jgi:hypothetical protein
VGDTYIDLGASITAPNSDLNLGINTYLNSALVSDIVLDTTNVATAQSGLTSTSTRTVMITAADAPPLIPPDNATSTAN